MCMARWRGPARLTHGLIGRAGLPLSLHGLARPDTFLSFKGWCRYLAAATMKG